MLGAVRVGGNNILAGLLLVDSLGFLILSETSRVDYGIKSLGCLAVLESIVTNMFRIDMLLIII